MAAGSPASAGFSPSGPLADCAPLSLSWFALGFVWLGVGAVLLLVNAPALVGAHGSGPLLGTAHAWMLGFLASATFGAVYQLLPVSLGQPLVWPRLGWLHLALHAVGTAAIVPGLLGLHYAWAGHAGSLVALGVLLFSLNVVRTVLRAGARDAVAWAFLLSACWLMAAVVMGILAALSRQKGFLPGNPDAWLRLHAHLGLLGFFITLIQGAAFRLVPMFTLGEVRSWGRVGLALALTQAGLLALSFSFVDEIPALHLLAVLAVAAGLAISGLELAVVFGSRRKRALDTGMLAFIGGGVGLAVCAVLGLLLTLLPEPGEGFLLHGPVAYGLLVLLGGLVPAVGGMLLKIVPFLVWLKRYGKLVGRSPVPLASQLSHPLLEQAWVHLHLAGLLLLLIGVARVESGWLGAGAAAVAASSFCSIATHLRVYSHFLRRNPTS